MKTSGCASAVDAACLLIDQGCCRAEAPLELHVLSASLIVRVDGMTDLLQLLVAYAGLQGEWSSLRDAEQACRLPPWPHDGVVKLSDLLRFLEARVAATPDLPQPSWLLQFRNVVLVVAAFAFELAIAHRLDSDDCDADKQNVAVLRGKTDVRRCRRSSLAKLQLIRRTRGQCGSANTVMDALAECHGYAALVRNVSNTLYSDLARESFADSRLISFGWDGASFSGLSVNIGMIIDCVTLRGCHVRPGVAPQWDPNPDLD